VAVDENVCWKLRTVYFLLGICFRAASLMLVWILCQVVSSDSWVSEVKGVLWDLRLELIWFAKFSHRFLSMAL
jgi:hypothetical protein